MAEGFGVVVGALSVAALFNNCVGCFEYIQLERHFARDFERCQLKLDIARTRLSRWGQSVGITEHPQLAADGPRDRTIQEAQAILEGIEQLFDALRNASKRYKINTKQEDLACLEIQTMRPVGRQLHSRLKSIVKKRQKDTTFVKKAAWALYDGKNFDKLVNEITVLVDDLEKLFPAKAIIRHELIQVEIEEVDDEPALQALEAAAVNVDNDLAQATSAKLDLNGGRSYMRELQADESARVRIGNEWTDAVLSRGLGLLPLPRSVDNGAGLAKMKGHTRIHIGNSFGSRGIFDD